MTPPDKLVQAAAEATCVGSSPCHQHMKEARIALAAAFAALPECDIRPPDWFPSDARDGWRDCLDALARFGDDEFCYEADDDAAYPACEDCGTELPSPPPGPPGRPDDIPLCGRCSGERARKGERVTRGAQRRA